MHLQPIQRIVPMVGFCLLTLSLVGFSSIPYPALVARQDSSLENQILQYVNEYRHSKNLSPLQMNTAITAQAAKHSADMATGKSSFGHDGFDNRVSLINKQLASSRKFAENVAYGHLGAKEVVNIWLNSAGHRHNIEGPYTLTGIGTARKEDGTVFFTQIFAAQ